MNLLNPILHNGKRYEAGKYDGGLPKDVEKDFISEGYFDLNNAIKLPQVDPDDLNIKGIQKLSVSKLKKAIVNLSNDELIELHELESNSEDPRKGALAAIDEALTD
jgi:hypothetical protein